MGKIKRGIRMKVNPEQSRKIQEICFENDIDWFSGTHLKHLDKPYIYINDSHLLGYRKIGEEELFNIDKHEEVSAELFIRTNGTCVEPKTLSEYLKENNAYESFIENCVEAFLRGLTWYKVFKSENKSISLGNIFIFEDTKEGHTYWYNLHNNQLKGLVYDMDEIIFAEVDKRIAGQKAQSEFISTEEFDQMFEQKTTTKYMVFVEGRSEPKKVHDSYDSAEKEAKRLSTKETGCNVSVLSVVKTFKSKVIVVEV